MKTSKGFVAPLLLALIALLLIGGGAYVYLQKQSNQPVTGNAALPQTTSNQTTPPAQTSNPIIDPIVSRICGGGVAGGTANCPTGYICKYPANHVLGAIDGACMVSSAPIINSITSSTDHDLVNVVISGNNLVDFSIVQYLSNGKLIDSFCGYLVQNGTLVHSWGQPEGGWTYYSAVDQMRIVNADCRTADIKSGLSGYPSATVNIRMVGNFPTLK